jgi:hypothetical protein
MPDWAQKLRERLSGMRLSAEQQEEIVAELAGHLEDVYENLIQQGVCAEDAEEQAWQEASSANKLVRRIRRAKQGEEFMNNRAKQIWLPALISSMLASCLLGILQNAGMRPTVVWIPQEPPALFYLPWLLSLPLFGFLGAFWSRRAGGSRRARIIAAIFPSLIYFAAPIPILPVVILIERHSPSMTALAWFILSWAILPCIALLLGALPIVLGAQKNLGPAQAAIHQ